MPFELGFGFCYPFSLLSRETLLLFIVVDVIIKRMLEN